MARLWLPVGVVIGLGLLNKLSMMWFGLGLGVGLLLTPQRRWLLTPWPWSAGAIGLALFAPHIMWQVHNGWPTLEFMRNPMQFKMQAKAPLRFLAEQVLILFACPDGNEHLHLSRPPPTTPRIVAAAETLHLNAGRDAHGTPAAARSGRRSRPRGMRWVTLGTRSPAAFFVHTADGGVALACCTAVGLASGDMCHQTMQESTFRSVAAQPLA